MQDMDLGGGIKENGDSADASGLKPGRSLVHISLSTE
jgi:hypothetical protein